MPISLPYIDGSRIYLKFEYLQKAAHPLIPVGTHLGFDQFDLSTEDMNLSLPESHSAVTAEQTKTGWLVCGEAFTYHFNVKLGTFDSCVINGIECFVRPAEFDIYRAPTENDMGEAGIASYGQHSWNSLRLDAAPICNLQAVYHVHGNGAVEVSMHGSVRKYLDYHPRFGMRYFLTEDFQNFTYFGYGPQENGSHYGTEECTLSNANTILKAYSTNHFSFCASEYTREELAAKKHQFELQKSGYTVWNIDYAMTGVGSGSCGPYTLEQYRLTEMEFVFDYTFFPQKKS